MRVGSLFSGYGGLDLGVLEVLGGEVAWHAEVEPAACRILDARWPGVPNLGDVTAVDWAAVEPVDVLTGGFPCQDVSAAGKRAGIRPGTRSGLWAHFAFAIEELRPALVVIENVRGLLSATATHPAHGDVEPCPWCVGDDEPVSLRALGAVLGELADLGYDARWHGLRAADVGAPHGRFRVFVTAWPVADAERDRRPRGSETPPSGRADGGRPWAGAAGSGADAAADAGGLDSQRRGGPGGLAGPPRPDQGAGDQRQRDGDAADHRGAAAWGPYEFAVRRWERVLGRPAPAPVEPNRRGASRLSPAFVEWMMGLPAGWVTAAGLTRNQELKALGNGVVPQQAAAALRVLLGDLEQESAA